MTCEVIQESETCVKPEVYVDCGTLPKGSTGIACLPTCQDAKPICESNTTHCLSGCACPEGTIKGEDYVSMNWIISRFKQQKLFVLVDCGVRFS